MRPNLMSPRRVSTSGEDSILALLEREPARKRGKGASGARLAWYGAGATVALALTGTLVWMAANNDGLRPEVQESILADAGHAAQRQATAATGATVVQVAMAPAAMAPEAPPRTAARIVDQAPADAVPPLRMLKPAPEKSPPEKRAPAASAAVAVRVPAAPPARAVARSTPPPRPTAAAATAAPAVPKPAVRPAAAPTRPKSALVAKSAARPGQPKAQRSVNPARSSDGSVDADVALISAVIVHANGHAPEGSQMTELLCPNDNCQARPPRQ